MRTAERSLSSQSCGEDTDRNGHGRSLFSASLGTCAPQAGPQQAETVDQGSPTQEQGVGTPFQSSLWRSHSYLAVTEALVAGITQGPAQRVAQPTNAAPVPGILTA